MAFAACLLVAILGLALLLPRDGWSHTRDGRQPRNCSVRVTNEQPNGERVKFKFDVHLESRSECQRLAKMHVPNYSPDTVAKKTVEWKWAPVR